MSQKRNAGLFIGVSLLSGFGHGVLSLVAGVWVMTLTGSSSLAGLASVFVYLPTLFGPLLGLVVDRVPRRPLLIWTNLATAGCVLTLLTVRSEDQTWQVYAVMLALGVAYVLLDAGESALLPAALSASSVGHVNGLRTSAQEGMKLIAPLAGAALFAWWGGPMVSLVASATLVVSAVLYGLIRLARTTSVSDIRATTADRNGVWEGLRYLFGDRTLRVIVLTAAVSIAMSGFITAAVFDVISVDLHRPPEYLGILGSAQGAGSIAGGLVVGRLMSRAGHSAIAVLGAVVFAAGCALRAVPLWPAQLASSVLTGIGLPWTLVAAMTAVQLRTPDALLGRVSASASAVLFGPVAIATPVGAAVVLVDHRLPLLIAAVACLVVTVPALRGRAMARAR